MPAFCQAAVWTPFSRLLDNRITSFLLKQVADFEDQFRGELGMVMSKEQLLELKRKALEVQAQVQASVITQKRPLMIT